VRRLSRGESGRSCARSRKDSHGGVESLHSQKEVVVLEFCWNWHVSAYVAEKVRDDRL